MINKTQAIYLFNIIKNEKMLGASPRGLVKAGLIDYRWGTSPSFGYKITSKGKKGI